MLDEKFKKSTIALMNYIEKSPSAWQATANAIEILEAAGFAKFNMDRELKTGDRCYVTKNSSALLAFEIGNQPQTGMKIYGAHSDSPGLKIKPQAVSISEGIVRLTTEVYGGPILSTWFDRPLSLAGRVILSSDNVLQPQELLIDFKRPILILPNVAIHMNREVNEGVKIEKHKVLLPFIACDNSDISDDYFEQLIARELDCEVRDILSFELITYEAVPPCLCGVCEEFVSAGRLDNLASTYAGLVAICEQRKEFNGINVLLVTDNEEVGSRTKQGADSFFARDVLESVYLALGLSRQEWLQSLESSFMISADLAHAVHPNYAHYADPDHRPQINGGPVIKLAASQAYASDARSSAIFSQLCQDVDVPCQYFVNRSDLRGGSTIGPITSAYLPVSTVDIGTPIWGMHSCRETGGIKDQYYAEQVIKYFYSL